MIFIVLVVVLGVLCAGGGLAKIAGAQVMRQDAAHFGFSYGSFRLIGFAELAGGAGICLALVYSRWLGVAAAVGLAALMVGAVVCHRRANDPAGKTAPAAVLGIVHAVIAYLFVVG